MYQKTILRVSALAYKKQGVPWICWSFFTGISYKEVVSYRGPIIYLFDFFKTIQLVLPHKYTNVNSVVEF